MSALATPPTSGPRQLDEIAIAELAQAFDGEIIRQTDPTYDDARHPWNGMIDKRPALIARPRGTAEVARLVRFARQHELEIAVRCGGHGTSGQSTTEGGLVIDLALMRASGSIETPAQRGSRAAPSSATSIASRSSKASRRPAASSRIPASVG
jgi:hypothetical protein